MTLWLTLAVNSIAFGGLPFLLSAGFSLMLGLVPISNLMHGSFFMLGAYFGVTLLAAVGQFLGRGAGERTRYGDHWGRGAALLRRLVGQELSDVPPGNSQCPVTRTCFLLHCKGLQVAQLCRLGRCTQSSAI